MVKIRLGIVTTFLTLKALTFIKQSSECTGAHNYEYFKLEKKASEILEL